MTTLVPVISDAQRGALLECARYGRGSYIWKPALMRSLVPLRLVEVLGERRGRAVFGLTPAGQALVAQWHEDLARRARQRRTATRRGPRAHPTAPAPATLGEAGHGPTAALA